VDSPSPVKVTGLPEDYNSFLSVGEVHACAVDEDGIAYCWGEGYGNSAVTVPGTGSGVGLIAMGDINAGMDGITCAQGGTSAYCWRPGSTPEEIPDVSGLILSFAIGPTHTCIFDGTQRTCVNNSTID
jgi:hypothetical protein